MKQIILKKSWTYKLLWFALFVISFYFKGGDKPLEAAIWLTPIFLLRFIRETKPYYGFLIVLPFVIIETLITDKGILPLPNKVFFILTSIKSAIFLMPFIFDRILYKYLPKYAKTLLFPALVIVVDVFLMSRYTGGTWGNPVYGIKNINLLQLSSVTGIWGIMFLIYWTAAFINELYESKFLLKNLRCLSIAYITIIILVWGYGIFRLNVDNTKSKMVEIAVVTPGENYRDEIFSLVGQVFASKRTGTINLPEMRKTIDARMKYLTSEVEKAAQTGVKIISWPEGVTFFEGDENNYMNGLIRIATEHNSYLAIGLFVIKDNCVQLVSENKPFIYNKFIFISPNEGIVSEYHKQHFSPGFEKMMTIPVENNMPVIETEFGKITGAICYDMDFPLFIRQAGQARADLLIAPSNDWEEIKNTHPRMARMRAIENGVSLLRPTGTGISIISDQYGRILSQNDDILSKGAPLVASIPVGSVFTIYPFTGNLIVWICVAFLVGLLIHIILSKIYSKK